MKPEVDPEVSNRKHRMKGKSKRTELSCPKESPAKFLVIDSELHSLKESRGQYTHNGEILRSVGDKNLVTDTRLEADIQVEEIRGVCNARRERA